MSKGILTLYYLFIIFSSISTLCYSALLSSKRGSELLVEIGAYEFSFGNNLKLPSGSDLKLNFTINRLSTELPQTVGSVYLTIYHSFNPLIENIDLDEFNSILPLFLGLGFNAIQINEKIKLTVNIHTNEYYLQISNGTSQNSGIYRVLIGTASDQGIESIKSGISFFDSECTCDRLEEVVLTKSNTDEVYQEVGNYEKNLGGSIRAPVGSTIKLLVNNNRGMPIQIFKDCVELIFAFSFQELVQPLEPGPTREMYPNLFAGYDFGQIEYILIDVGDNNYNGVYSVRVTSLDGDIIDSACTEVEFTEADFPIIIRGQKMAFVTNSYSSTLTTIGNNVVINTPLWNSISLDASLFRGSPPITWVWSFKPIGKEQFEQIITAENYDIFFTPNRSVFTLRYSKPAETYGTFRVSATNKIGSSSLSTEIQQVSLPKFEISSGIVQFLDKSISVTIGQKIHFPQFRSTSLSIEIRAKDIGGFPRSEIMWYYSILKDSSKNNLANSSGIMIKTDSNGYSTLEIKTNRESILGYYCAVAENLFGFSEECTLIGRKPELERSTNFYSVFDYRKGYIGDTFSVYDNAPIKIIADEKIAFPISNFTWHVRDAFASIKDEKIDPEKYTVSNIVGRSALTIINNSGGNQIFSCIASNEFGKSEVFSKVYNNK